MADEEEVTESHDMLPVTLVAESVADDDTSTQWSTPRTKAKSCGKRRAVAGEREGRERRGRKERKADVDDEAVERVDEKDERAAKERRESPDDVVDVPQRVRTRKR